jgi:hypothetical protein
MYCLLVVFDISEANTHVALQPKLIITIFGIFYPLAAGLLPHHDNLLHHDPIRIPIGIIQVSNDYPRKQHIRLS